MSANGIRLADAKCLTHSLLSRRCFVKHSTFPPPPISIFYTHMSHRRCSPSCDSNSEEGDLKRKRDAIVLSSEEEDDEPRRRVHPAAPRPAPVDESVSTAPTWEFTADDDREVACALHEIAIIKAMAKKEGEMRKGESPLPPRVERASVPPQQSSSTVALGSRIGDIYVTAACDATKAVMDRVSEILEEASHTPYDDTPAGDVPITLRDTIETVVYLAETLLTMIPPRYSDTRDAKDLCSFVTDALKRRVSRELLVRNQFGEYRLSRLVTAVYDIVNLWRRDIPDTLHSKYTCMRSASIAGISSLMDHVLTIEYQLLILDHNE